MNFNIEYEDLLIEKSTLSEESKNFLLKHCFNTYEKLNDYNLSELKFLECPFRIILEIGQFKEKVNKVFLTKDFEKIKDFFNIDILFKEEVSEYEEVKNQNLKLKLPLEILELSVRSFHALKRAGFNDLTEIIDFTFEDFTQIRNLGSKSIKEIMSLCEYYKDNMFVKPNPESDNNQEETNLVSQDDFLNYASYLNICELGFNIKAKNVLCANNIKSLSEILSTNLYNLHSLGRTTKRHIDEVCSYEKNLFRTINYLSKEGISDIPFNCIQGYSETRYKHLGHMTINEIHDLFCTEYEDVLRINSYEDFALIRLFIKLKSGLIEDINSKLEDHLVANHIFDRERDIFIKRTEGYTLEMLGEIYEVQRERIRQIESKTLMRLKNIFKTNNILNYLHFAKKIDLSLNETILNDDFYKIFVCRLDEMTEYKKVEINGKIYFYDSVLYQSIENLFENLLKSIELNGFTSYEMLESFSSDQDLLSYFIEKNNLEIINGLLTLKINKRGKIALYLKRNLIIDVSKDNIKNVMEDLAVNYGLKFDSERAFIGVLSDVAYSLGGGRYTSLDNNPIIAEDVMQLIINDIETKKFIKADALYVSYKDKTENLLSPTHLYLYIKKLYPDIYNYGGVNLVISTKGTKTSQSARVYEHLQTVAKPVKRDDLVLMFGLDSVAINVIDQQNDDIIKYGKDKYFLKKNLYAGENDTDVLYKYISGIQSFYVDDLYKYCLIKKLSLIADNFITTVEEFTSFCCNWETNLFEDFTLNKEDYRFVRNKVEDDLVYNNSEYEFEL